MQKRRAHERFVIRGATVFFNQKKLFHSQREYYKEDYPALNMSRGGRLFSTNKLLKIKTRVSLKIFIPHDDLPLCIKGRVCRIGLNSGVSNKYQIGIRFSPFCEKKRGDSLECLNRLNELERRYLEKREENFGILPYQSQFYSRGQGHSRLSDKVYTGERIDLSKIRVI